MKKKDVCEDYIFVPSNDSDNSEAELELWL